MISRNHVDLLAALFEDLAGGIDISCPVHQVAGGEIVIRLGLHVPLESSKIAVNIGKDQQLHAYAMGFFSSQCASRTAWTL